MAATVKEIKEWLKDMPDDALIGIEDGGLSIAVVGEEEDNYFEIGGVPEEGSYLI